MKSQLIIIGSGPAGLTAGIYAARAELKPVIFSGEKAGGQLINTSIVENWPGADEGILGGDLMLKMRQQAQKFGAEIIDKNVDKVDFSRRPFKLYSSDGEYSAEAVIIATGAENVFLNIPGEKELLGRGVAVCAVCDAAFYKDKVALVVGGGDTAAEDALALTRFAKQVYLIVRRDALRASKIMAKRLKNNPKIKILWNSQLTRINGTNKVESVVINQQDALKADGVFLAIGHQPASEIFKDQLVLTDSGYILTGKNPDYPTMTSVAGVFAAGDCVDYRYRQAITAAAMGCQAAIDAGKWLEKSDD